MIDYTVERRASRPRLLRLGGVGYVNWSYHPKIGLGLTVTGRELELKQQSQ